MQSWWWNVIEIGRNYKKEINVQLRQSLPNKPTTEKNSTGQDIRQYAIFNKKLEINAAERNSDRVTDIRKIYSDFFLQEGVLFDRVIFIDESGYNLWTARTRGLSKIGGYKGGSRPKREKCFFVTCHLSFKWSWNIYISIRINFKRNFSNLPDRIVNKLEFPR